MFAKLKFAALVLLGAWSVTVHAALPIQHWKTSQGVPVYFMETHSLPMVDVRVNFDAGSARDGQAHGLASLTAALLDQGVRAEGGQPELDAQSVAEGFENIGARMGAAASVDSASLSLRTLSNPQRLEPAFNLFTRVMAQPSLPPDAFSRERDRALLGLKAAEQKPDSVAQRTFYKALYGDHPYAWLPAGDIASVQALTLADVKRFHATHYVQAGMSIVLVGDLDRAKAEALAERLAAELPKGEAQAPIPAPTALTASKTIHVPFPSSQATILMGQLGMSRHDADYFPLYVGNHILGGSGFSSILMDEIREKRGLAYGTYSYLSPMQQPGPFVMGVQTKLEQAEQAEKLMRESLARFIEQGPTPQQLDHAKKNIIGGFPLRLDSNADIANWLAILAVYQLPLDFLERYTANVAATTRESIRNAWQQRIHPDRLLTVIVGGEGKAEAAKQP